MNDQPTARTLLEVAALVAAGEAPPPDWLDDRDIAVLFVISTAHGLAELLGSRDDLADGLTSGRYTLVVAREGVALVEQSV